jgi:hypothetical protein
VQELDPATIVIGMDKQQLGRIRSATASDDHAMRPHTDLALRALSWQPWRAMFTAGEAEADNGKDRSNTSVASSLELRTGDRFMDRMLSRFGHAGEVEMAIGA